MMSSSDENLDFDSSDSDETTDYEDFETTTGKISNSLVEFCLNLFFIQTMTMMTMTMKLVMP